MATLNLDGTRRKLDRDLLRLALFPADDPDNGFQVAIDADAPIAWRELDKLPDLADLDYRGRALGLEDYVATRGKLRKLRLSNHGRARVDLRATRLAELAVDVPEGPFELWLPPTLVQLRILGERPLDQVVVRGMPAGIAATLWAGGAIRGLEAVRELTMMTTDVRIDDYAGCAALDQLRLWHATSVVGLPRLGRLRLLRVLALTECYRLDVDPDAAKCPALERVEIDGIRSQDAEALAAWLAPAKLAIRGKRTDAWLRANVDNPFRAWSDEHGATVGTRAAKIWRDGLTAIDRAVASKRKTDAKTALVGFVAAFDKLHAKHDIDTIMREEIGTAFDELVGRAGKLVDRKLAQRWFEARDF